MSRTALTVSERLHQQSVVDLATLLGYRHFHPLNMKGSDPGWPDLILCRPPRLIAAELKGPEGRLTPEQHQWLQVLSGCGVETHVWRAGTDTLRDIAEVLYSKSPVVQGGSR